MNERIKELAVQADFMLCTDGRFYSEGRYLDITLELEKFAELVIKDCLGACIADVADPRNTVELKCAKKIKASWDDESWPDDTMIRPTPFQVRTGQVFMEVLMDAAMQNDMDGLGECKSFDMADFPEKFHDLIRAYLNKEMYSVEACFIAMSRESETKLKEKNT